MRLLAKAEPKTLRYRILHTAARLTAESVNLSGAPVGGYY